jgi:hypothetical protein
MDSEFLRLSETVAGSLYTHQGIEVHYFSFRLVQALLEGKFKLMTHHEESSFLATCNVLPALLRFDIA